MPGIKSAQGQNNHGCETYLVAAPHVPSLMPRVHSGVALLPEALRTTAWCQGGNAPARPPRGPSATTCWMLEKRDFIAAFIVHFHERLSVSPPSPPAEMAMGLMSLVEGVKSFRLSSPQDMSAPAAESILTLFLDALIRLARSRPAALTRTDPRRSRY